MPGLRKSGRTKTSNARRCKGPSRAYSFFFVRRFFLRVGVAGGIAAWVADARSLGSTGAASTAAVVFTLRADVIAVFGWVRIGWVRIFSPTSITLWRHPQDHQDGLRLLS